jgi:hypothetical protein
LLRDVETAASASKPFSASIQIFLHLKLFAGFARAGLASQAPGPAAAAAAALGIIASCLDANSGNGLLSFPFGFIISIFLIV